MIDSFDYALVGGGLQNGLAALALRAHQPAARIVMIERGTAPGGNHTWCFHAGDLRDSARAWIEPLIVTRWDGYDVAFPSLRRHLDSPYACVTSERLARCVAAVLAQDGSALLLQTQALDVAADHVTVRTADARTRTLHATTVIDARGPDRSDDRDCGWQKFVGHEVVLAEPHGLTCPVLMDATVPQLDGFRFFYVLPLAPDRLLVEDTCFSDVSWLDVTTTRAEIAAYCRARGWQVVRCDREEVGVLPLPWRTVPPRPTAPLVAGYAGGWFHPVTGYSFPIAARLAETIASGGTGVGTLATEHARQLRFALFLNHMLFHWFAPELRYHVLERFYRKLPEDAIRRFYALELTARDRARILVGAPPRGFSLRAALGLEAR